MHGKLAAAVHTHSVHNIKGVQMAIIICMYAITVIL